jgi:hypothetical protein
MYIFSVPPHHAIIILRIAGMVDIRETVLLEYNI